MIKVKKTKSAAFTLIELLVVIVIIAILAAAIIMALNNARKKAADSNLQDALAKVTGAISVFRTDSPTDQYPDSLADLQQASATVQLPGVLNDAHGNPIGYIKKPVTGDGYIVYGQRVGNDWYFVKDGVKCFKDSLGKPADYGSANCP